MQWWLIFTVKICLRPKYFQVHSYLDPGLKVLFIFRLA